MITVGIKELKTRLSRYVARVRAGEEIIITDHGREKDFESCCYRPLEETSEA